VSNPQDLGAPPRRRELTGARRRRISIRVRHRRRADL
jgi:hypothetical protein